MQQILVRFYTVWGLDPTIRAIQNVYPSDLKRKSLDDGRFEGIQEIMSVMSHVSPTFFRPTSNMSKLETNVKKTSFVLDDLEVP